MQITPVLLHQQSSRLPHSYCDLRSLSCYIESYLPDLPIQQNWIDKVKNDRQFAYEVLCGGRPHTQKPQFCPICDKGRESSSECQFYRKDSRLAYEGKLPPEYARIRGQLIKRRYLVLDERAETHKHKFVMQTMINNFGEKNALEELENTSKTISAYVISPF
jgi:hypothetical protein